MRINNKSTVVVVLVLLALMPIGVGCIGDGNTDVSETETETTQEESPPGVPSRMNWSEVAEILGIDAEEVENAFLRARSELAEGSSFAPRTKESPDGSLRERVPPERLPEGKEPSEGMRTPVGRQLPEPILAKMAEILSIDQQQLEDAFAQAQGESNTQ